MPEKKRKSVYVETYKKGTVLTDHNEIINWIKQKGITLAAINAGKYDDDTEYITIRIDGIK